MYKATADPANEIMINALLPNESAKWVVNIGPRINAIGIKIDDRYGSKVVPTFSNIIITGRNGKIDQFIY